MTERLNVGERIVKQVSNQIKNFGAMLRDDYKGSQCDKHLSLIKELREIIDSKVTRKRK